MYLSKLDILGFKSFAQKTNVSFNAGITSIVGPNGCGKTNIVDAIRWCLGEQRSSALRSDKMENVIFNGTSNKKPMGMAEVSLTIENNKGILPTEYSEVTITRRIFRSGESEYLLNKNICRLKDITNLFMDTGIGSNAYSVIELKMVETILSNKAEERRIMFEEAAGVNKYKLRRRLALKKLDEVKADLTRVNDIVSEVEKKVNYLERQAKKADKFNKLSASLRELELDLAERELSLFTIRKEEAKNKKDEFFSKKISVESSLAEIEDEVASIKSELGTIETELSGKRSEIGRQIEKIYSHQKNISVNEERARSLSQNINRYKNELEEFVSEIERLKELAEGDRDILDDISNKTSKLKNEKIEFEEKVNSFKQQFEEKKNALKERQDLIFNKFKELTSQEHKLSTIKNSLTRINISITKLNEKIQTLTGNIAKTVGYIEDLNNEKDDTEKKLKEAEEIYSLKQTEKTELEKEISELKTRELEQKSVINAIKDKISFIQNLIDNLEGVSKGAKVLIENNNWSQGDKTLLANAGTAPSEYRLAVEGALKNNLNNILIESLEDLKNGIEYLKNSESGKASFYLNEAFEGKKQNFIQKIYSYLLKKKIKKLNSEPGVTCWAKDVLVSDDKWKSFFQKILSNTVIVNDLDVAFELFKKYPEFNFATLTGDFIDNSGVIEAGSLPRLDDTLFGRKQLLENLKNEYPVKEEELEELRVFITLKEEELNQIDLKVLSDKGRFLVNDLANIEKQIAQFEFEKNKAIDEIEKARKELQDFAGESNRLDSERMNLAALIEAQYAEKHKEDEEKQNLEKEFSAFEAEYNANVNALNKVNINLERLAGEYKNTNNEIDRAYEQIESITRSIAKREKDIDESENEQIIITDILDEKREELDDFQSIKARLDKEKDEIEANYNAIKEKVTSLETKQRNLRKERDFVSDEIHKAEMVMNELKIKIDNLYEAIKENYSYTLEIKQYEDLDTFDFKARTDEVHQFKQQIKNLGQFNLMAHSEYEEEKERFEFLNKQRNDLIESEKDIVKTITEINTTAQTLFAETFDKIRTNFINIFRNLFNPGDEADLKLEENVDPLEAKIEIVAKPKGKRPTSIELLSGGEKTLTAIALLFAIYLVKPSPFCILDEVDAPLDDANIDRYIRIIRDFSKDTQFIVVTHNKRTMEGADTLYGVTMQEEGVSKLVSVRFNEDFNFA